MAILNAIQGVANSAASSIRNALGLGMTELERQQLTGDDRFYQPYVAFFELVNGATSYLFPLTFAPQQIQVSEPFAVQVTPTLDSHLIVEEGGIIQRRITLAGSTGFAPRPWTGSTIIPNNLGGSPPNYAPSDLPSSIVAALSGPRQFEYLRGVFRAYSDLKRNPTTAQFASLLLHLPSSGDHFRVIPLNFAGVRSAQSPFTTPYQIDLLAVDGAAPTSLPVAAVDQGWLGDFRDAVAATNHALGNLRGAINDLTAVQGSFRILGGQVTAIIDNASSIAIAAQNFLGGTSQLLDLPVAAVSSLFNLVVQTLGVYTDTLALGNQLADWPQAVVQRFRGMLSACDALLSHPEIFSPPPDALLAGLNRAAQDVAAGSNAVAVTSFADIQRAGSANLPGDAIIAASQPANTLAPTFRSLRQVVVRRGDSLIGLAQSLLGDGRLWRAIALANAIKPPLVGAQGRFYASLSDAAAADAGLLAPGQTLIVPSTQAPATQAGSPVVLGVPSSAPAEERLLGRDLALSPTPGPAPLFDLSVADGDLATLAGAPVLAQAVGAQLTQPRGSNVLYPSVGLEAVVGTGLAQADYALVRYRVQSALTRDPRVAGVQSLDIALNGTEVRVNAILTAAGLDATIPISIAA